MRARLVSPSFCEISLAVVLLSCFVFFLVVRFVLVVLCVGLLAGHGQ